MSSLLATVVVLLAVWCALGISFWRKHRTLRERRWVYEEADDRAFWDQLAEWWYDDPAARAAHDARVAAMTDLMNGDRARYNCRCIVASAGLRTWSNW